MDAAERVEVVCREETNRVDPHFVADILWVLSDPLDDDFGRTVEPSLVLHSIGDRGLTRDGFFVRRLTV